MMLMGLLSHLLSAWFAFFIPVYSTLKAISHRPATEPQVQRWIKYWVVIGAVVAIEYAAEWLVSWFPFYWEVKTLFLLFLALPQTEGSTYIFDTYMYPLFIKREAELDAWVSASQQNFAAFLQSRLQALLNYAPRVLQQSRPGTGPSNSANSPFSLASALNFLQSFTPRTTTAGTPMSPPTMQGQSTAPSSTQRQGEQLPNSQPGTPPAFPVPQHF